MGSPKGYPKDVKELCDRLRPYFDELDTWLRKKHPDVLAEGVKPGGPLMPDPPPKPPDLGP